MPAVSAVASGASPQGAVRYRDVCFEDVQVTRDVVYATAKGYWTALDGQDDELPRLITEREGAMVKRALPLKLDVYEPAGDSLSKRPLVMLLHGGAFYMHSKDEICMVEWCRELARRGYVAVSIDYRLGFRLNKGAIERAGYRALQDALSALRFLVSEKETYRIDERAVFVGGSSSGAITALNTVFMNDDNRPASTRRLGPPEPTDHRRDHAYSILGIIDMWGAVNDLSMLETADVPILGFQSRGDRTVPFGHDYSLQGMKPFNRLFFNKIYGSGAIAGRYADMGRDMEFYPFEGDRHAPQKDASGRPNDNFRFILEKICAFCSRLLPGSYRQR